MMKWPKFSLCLSFVCFLLLLCIKSTSQNDWNQQDFFRREHSLSKPYGGTGTGIPYWDFVGSTIVTNKFIRLTAESQSKHLKLFILLFREDRINFNILISIASRSKRWPLEHTGKV